MNTALPLPYLLGNNTSNYPPSPPYGNDPNFDPNFYTHEYIGEGAYIDDRDDNQGISPYQYPTPSTTGSNPSYNPSAFHSSHNALPTQIPPNMMPNFLDLPGPSTYHNQIYTDSSPSGSGGVVHEGAKVETAENEDILEDVGTSEENKEGAVGGEGGEVDNEEPLYVNAKQYHRILKRRAARQRLEELNRLARSRKPYLHESRHRHACSRPRGKGGRFLTAEEIEALKKEEAAKGGTQQEQAL